MDTKRIEAREALDRERQRDLLELCGEDKGLLAYCYEVESILDRASESEDFNITWWEGNLEETYRGNVAPVVVAQQIADSLGGDGYVNFNVAEQLKLVRKRSFGIKVKDSTMKRSVWVSDGGRTTSRLIYACFWRTRRQAERTAESLQELNPALRFSVSEM